MDFKLNQMKAQLKIISIQLYILEEAASTILHKIDQGSFETPHVVLAKFNDKQDKIQELNLFFAHFANNSNDYSRNNFIKECEQNNMIKFAKYVQGELKSERKLNLKDIMLKKNNLRKFESWSKVLGNNLATALILHMLCLHARIIDNTTLAIAINQDKTFMKNVIFDLEHLIKSGTKQIKQEYMKYVPEEVTLYTKAHPFQPPMVFISNLYTMLSKKYYWRYWFLASHNLLENGDVSFEHDSFEHVYYVKSLYGRSIYIASTNNPESIQDKLAHCSRPTADQRELWYNSAKYICDDIWGCVWPYNGLIVVRNWLWHIGVAAHAHIITRQTTWMFWSYEHAYSAFAVAKGN